MTFLSRIEPSRPNRSVNQTPCQLRWQVPFALRAPVAGYVERFADALRRTTQIKPTPGGKACGFTTHRGLSWVWQCGQQ